MTTTTVLHTTSHTHTHIHTHTVAQNKHQAQWEKTTAVKPLISVIALITRLLF